MKNRSTLLAEWIELYNGMLGDPKKPQVIAFIRRCRAVEKASGKRQLIRTKDCVELLAPTHADLDVKVMEFHDRPDVRMLRTGIEVNGADDVPGNEPLTDELLNGTACIYALKE